MIRRRERAAFTLLELLVGMAILTTLGTALVLVLRGGLSTWRRSEARRESYDAAQAIFRQLREDLASICPPGGPPLRDAVPTENRLLCDLRHPENAGAPLALGVGQRLVLVRSLKAESEHPITGHAGMFVGADRVVDLRDDLDEARAGRLRATGGQAEVAWVRSEEGVLYRGLRAPVGPPNSLFEPGSYALAAPPRPLEAGGASPGAAPAAGAGARVAPQTLLRPFATEVLHLEFRFWSQYSRNSWKARDRCLIAPSADERSGPLLVWDSTRSLELDDGRARERGEFTTYLSARSAADPRDDILPRRVRILLVLRQPPLAGRSTFLLAPIDARSSEVLVEHPERLEWSEEEGGYLYVGGEWIHFERVEGNVVRVSPGGRGARWTRAQEHDTGQIVEIGKSFVSIVAVPAAREDWADPVRRLRRAR